MFFFGHGERGARVDSGWGGRGRTAQCPPLRAANSVDRGRTRQQRKGKEGGRRRRGRGREIRKINCPQLHFELSERDKKVMLQ